MYSAVCAATLRFLCRAMSRPVGHWSSGTTKNVRAVVASSRDRDNPVDETSAVAFEKLVSLLPKHWRICHSVWHPLFHPSRGAQVLDNPMPKPHSSPKTTQPALGGAIGVYDDTRVIRSGCGVHMARRGRKSNVETVRPGALIKENLRPAHIPGNLVHSQHSESHIQCGSVTLVPPWTSSDASDGHPNPRSHACGGFGT